MAWEKKLYFEYNKFGTVKKLCLEGITPTEASAICNGASPSKDKTVIRFPLEELYARRLIRLIDGLKVHPSVTRWLEECVQTAKARTLLTQKEDVILSFPTANKLYPFQRVDVAFMKEAGNVLNANQMGTGKTVECAGLIEEIQAKKVLCLVSKSKLDDWKEELEKWTGCSDIVVVKGSPKQKEALLKKPARIYIMTHASIRGKKSKGSGPIDYGIYTNIFLTRFDLIIVDEAHKFKNSKAQQSIGARKLLFDRMVLLTGTPMLNSPKDLWALLNLLYPDRFTSYWQFVERFCEMEENPFGKKPMGIKNEEALQYTLLPFTLRRLKKDVMPWLPDKIYKTIKIDLDGEQQRMYKQMEKEMVVDFTDGEEVCAPSTLSQMLRLRQLALCPRLLGGETEGAKTEALLEILEECIESGEKVVVFSYFKEYLKHIARLLNNRGIKYGMIHGETRDADRERAKKMFNTEKDCFIFLCSIGAGGEGLNLQVASTLIFTDKDWVPGIIEQCEDRIHRDGQLKNPLIISLVARNSIDEDIEEVLADKTVITTKGLAIRKIAEKLMKEAG